MAEKLQNLRLQCTRWELLGGLGSRGTWQMRRDARCYFYKVRRKSTVGQTRKALARVDHPESAVEALCGRIPCHAKVQIGCVRVGVSK